MLRARNIFIIFIVNYLIILIACSILETYHIANTAQQVQMMMQTAADMALEQVQATDDFFTTGGYFKGDSSDNENSIRSEYSIATITNMNQLQTLPFFSNYTGRTGVHEINDFLYPTAKLKEFVNENPKVKDMSIYGATLDYVDSTAEGDKSVVLKWIKFPRIDQLGVGFEEDIVPIKNTDIISGAARSNLFKNYELGSANSQFIDDSGNPVEYSLTPLSIGITYINEEVLQYFYMNNMHLLMRAKYANSAGLLPSGYEGGKGVFLGNSYSDFVDSETLNRYNPVHNGKYTLLLGDTVPGTLNGLTLYQGLQGRMPKVEYTVIDMYDDSNNEFLKTILGPKINVINVLSTSDLTGENKSATSVNDSENMVNLTASYLRDTLDKDNIDYYKSVIGNNDVFNHKYMVVAKVTFYADVVVPYQTVGLREMRIRENDDNSLSGRTLFDPFSDISRFGVGGSHTYTEKNYSDMILKIEGSDLRNKYLTDANGNSFVNLDGVTSDPMVYTTYFAVTP